MVLFELDSSGNILRVSGAVERLFGMPPASLAGKNWWDLLFPGSYRPAADELWGRIISGEDVAHARLPGINPQARQVLLDLTTANSYTRDGRLERISGAAQDVTAYIASRLRLEKIEQEFNQMQKLAKIGSWIWDLQADAIHWSDTVYDIYGLDNTGDSLTSDQIAAFNYPEDDAQVKKILADAVMAGGKAEFDHRIIRADGSTRYLIHRAEVIAASDEHPARVVGTTQDVTQHKQSELDSRARDELLRAAVVNAPITLFVIDPQGQLLLAIGHDLPQPSGETGADRQSIYDLFPANSTLWEDVNRAQQGETFSAQVSSGDKTYEFRYEPLNNGLEGQRGVLGVGFEITGLIQAEEKIIENEKRFRQIIESVQDYAIYMLSPEGVITSWNTGAQAIKGYTEAEVLNTNFSRFFTPEDQHAKKPTRILGLAAQHGKYEEEAWRVRKDGTRFWASIMITAIHDPSGQIVGFSKVVRDMTQRKAAEERLRQQTEYIRLLQDVAVASNKATHLEDTLHYSLSRVCDQTGWNVGHALTLAPDRAGEMISTKTWYLSDPDRFEAFRAATEGTHFSAGVGLPGSVLAQGKPIWLNHLGEQDTFLRKTAAQQCGLQTAIAFPIMVGKTVAGVMEFYSQEERQVDEQFVQVITQIGTQIGRVIERNQMEAELIELQRSIHDGREAERLELAQELHDGPVQDMYGIFFQMKAASGSLPDQHILSDEMQTMMTQVISKLRSICKELRPPTLAPFGLEKAIRAHAEAFMQENKMQIDLDLEPDGQALSERIRLVLFRIYQQIVVHMLRHAEATRVKVRFSFDEKEIILEIEDNAEGFVVPMKWIELARQGHIGLVGAAERAEAIGGKLEVQSDPERGTRVRVTAPRNTSGFKSVQGG